MAVRSHFELELSQYLPALSGHYNRAHHQISTPLNQLRLGLAIVRDTAFMAIFGQWLYDGCQNSLAEVDPDEEPDDCDDTDTGENRDTYLVAEICRYTALTRSTIR